jgi:hypothetical protein
MSPIRPDLALLWPSYTLFPLAAVGVLVFGAAGGDPVMVGIGLGLLATNALIVLNQAYFTTLAIESDELVFRTNFGTKEERVAIGALQRIDAKRYPGAHSGVSAPFFVARGRDSTVKVNTKAYRLAAFAPLIALGTSRRRWRSLRGAAGRRLAPRQAPALDRRAAIPHHAQAGRFRALGGGDVAERELEPDRLHARGDRVVDDGVEELAASEDVDEVHVDVRWDVGEVIVRTLALDDRATQERIHRDDAVALRAKEARDGVARS